MLEEGMEVSLGDRVKAEFAHREYIGVVSRTNADPASEGVAEDSIKSILGKEENLPPVSALEIEFWRKISSYNLCTAGEVYKAAYPALRTAVRNPRKKSATTDETPAAPPLSDSETEAMTGIRSALGNGKTVLLDGINRTGVYINLALEFLAKGESVLFLVPEIALSRQLEEKVRKAYPQLRTFHSQETAATKRLVEKEVREGTAKMVLGTRSSLFLPFRNLGLIIVDDDDIAVIELEEDCIHEDLIRCGIRVGGIVVLIKSRHHRLTHDVYRVQHIGEQHYNEEHRDERRLHDIDDILFELSRFLLGSQLLLICRS